MERRRFIELIAKTSVLTSGGAIFLHKCAAVEGRYIPQPRAPPRKGGKSCGIISAGEIEQKHMATLIPAISTCVSRMTPGERRTAERLEQKLDADYRLWYDVPVGPLRQHPDFVVMHPRRGILILEVKDFRLSTLIHANKQTWDIHGELGPKTIPNPLEQARQYAHQVVHALEITNEAVSQLFASRLPATLTVMVPILLLDTLLAVPIALGVAYVRGSLTDRTLMVVTTVALSISFLVYIIVGQYLFGFQLGWFPVQGWSDSTWNNLLTYVPLPVLLAVLVGVSPQTRLYRSFFLDELGQDYVRTARAKGLSEAQALRTLAQRAGLQPLEIADVTCHWVYPDLATALRGLGSSGVAVKAAQASSQETVDEAHAAALAPFRQPQGGYRVGASFRWLLAAP